MSVYDLGDLVPLGITVRDASGAAADAGSVTLVVTLPDGTTSSPTVARDGLGLYSATFAPTLAGAHAYRWTATAPNAVAFADVFVVEQAMAGLVSLAELRQHLGKTQTASDEDLRRIGLVATELAEEYLGQSLRRRTVVETHDGGKTGVVLRQGPVQSVTAVTEAGTSVASTGWVLDASAGILYRGTTAGAWAWTTGVQNVVVTYVVGPPTSGLAKLGQGVREIARHLWDTQRGGGSALPRQQGAGDEWTSGMGYSVPRRVMELLGTRTSGIA